ncbi:MAG TPA: YSC84-related protein [Candidatus Omnitrophota bacterium]|nr:YSC84-related protein [Candidatus Omnitrophota bacterium]HPS19699.1 YSC84-related protein [Candidatus Omnitrophota bacterium]
MFRSFIPKSFFVSLICCSLLFASSSFAGTAKEIDASVDAALDKFDAIKGGSDIIKKAQGTLIFPSVVKAGLGLGGEYGEGALRIKGKTVDYYNTAAASIGFQLGVQQKTIIIVFTKKDALDKFRASDGWKVGLDASIAVVAVGAGGALDSSQINQPIVAFVLDQKGLMYNLTLEGAKITKIKK